MNENINITDVKKILSKFGYIWDGTYYNRQKGKYVVAKDFREIVSTLYPTQLLICINKDKYEIRVSITKDKFVIYEEKCEILGSGSSFYPKDYSNIWQQFLKQSAIYSKDGVTK